MELMMAVQVPSPPRETMGSKCSTTTTSSDATVAVPEAFYETPPREETITIEKAGHTTTTSVLIYNDHSNNTDTIDADVDESAQETLVVVHGLGGCKEQFQEGRVAQRLATKYRVITFDWHGHGASSPTPNKSDHKESFVEQLHQVVTKYVGEDDKFHLYAFSMGCYLSLQYCHSHPNRVNRLVLHSPWNAEVSLTAKTACVIPGIYSMLQKTCFDHCHDVKTLKKIVTTLGDGPRAWKDLLQNLATSSASKEAEGAFGGELLVICGTAENPFLRVAKEIHKTLHSKSTLCKVPKAGHMTWCFQWDKPVGRLYRDTTYNFLVADKRA